MWCQTAQYTESEDPRNAFSARPCNAYETWTMKKSGYLIQRSRLLAFEMYAAIEEY